MQASDQRAFVEIFKIVGEKRIRNFWERSGAPGVETDTPLLDALLQEMLGSELSGILQAPFNSKVFIADRQFERAARLIEHACEIPVYKARFAKAGIQRGCIGSWDDFRKIAPITKQELQAAYPEGCVHPSMQRDICFQTRSSGSSGASLKILVDLEAIAVDTMQGVRQFSLQSGLRYKASDTVANVYTVPWWTGAIDGHYLNHFISSLIAPDVTAGILAELRPNILSLYPTNLESLMPFYEKWRDGLHLVVTHSEQSTRNSRRGWTKKLGVPVLDEYSSEEGTRIALECPCGHYHSCDDTVILEILDPVTLLPQQPGKPGLVVVTNLLNQAMPFIRYVQGDLATAVESADCSIQWGCIENIEGRVNDAFVTREGVLVPAGTLLDVTYRMMYDCGLNLRQFELVQTGYDTVVLVAPDDIDRKEVETARDKVAQLLGVIMEHPVTVDTAASRNDGNGSGGKRRPIRREFEHRR